MENTFETLQVSVTFALEELLADPSYKETLIQDLVKVAGEYLDKKIAEGK